MHLLYAEAMEVTDRLKEARLQVVHLSAEFAQAAYDLAVSKARVERALVKKVGDEKRLGPTTESRERVFTLARDADEGYLDQRKRHNEAKTRLDQAKAEVASLRERLEVLLTVMKASGQGEHDS